MTAAPAWLDGRMLPAGAAAIPATDLGLRLGLGVFETFRVESGHVLGLDAHLDRLVAGGARLGLDVDPAWVREGLVVLLAAAAAPRSTGPIVARVTVTAGDAAEGWPPEPGGATRTLVTVHPAPTLPTPPVAAAVVPGPRAPAGLADVKTLSYAGSVHATRIARAREAEVALMEDDGEVLEAADGNLLVLRGDTLTTPPTDGRILPGVTRSLVLALAPDLGLHVSERPVRRGDLADADLVLVSSAVRRLRRVDRIDGRPVGGGAAGASTVLDGLRAGLAALTEASQPLV